MLIRIPARNAVMSNTDTDPRTDMVAARLQTVQPLEGASELAVFQVAPLEDQEIPEFVAGQHTTVAFEQDGAPTMRYYSIASPPEQRGHLEFYIRKPAKTGGTADLFDFEVGHPLWFGKPGGGFTLARTQKPNLAFVANGSGLAPFRSMLHHLRSAGQSGDPIPQAVTLWHGVKTPAHLGFRAEFEELAAQSRQGELPFRFAYIPTQSAPDETDPEVSQGRVEELLANFLGWPSAGDTRPCNLRHPQAQTDLAQHLPAGETAIFLCGAPDMLRSVIRVSESSAYHPDLVYDLWG